MIAYRIALSCLLSAAAFGALAADTLRVLPGTEVKLTFAQPLSSQTAYKNQNFRLLVAEDVRVGGQVVVPKGTEAMGIVIRAEGTGSFGKPGNLHLRIQWLSLQGRRIPLFSSMAKKGKEGDTGAVWLTAFFGPVGGLVRGKKVEIPEGTPVLAYIDQAFEVPAAAPLAAPAGDPTTDTTTTGPDEAPVVAPAMDATTATSSNATPLPATDRNADVQTSPHP